MSHTYCSILCHCIFSTAGRRKLIAPAWRERLWAYIAGIAREHGMHAIAVGGVDDHVHILLSLPASMALANAMRTLKSGSSKWIHDQIGLREFEWQKGYGAFSIGQSQRAATTAYIAGQADHHRRRDFQAEFAAILKKHGLAYEEG